MSARAAARCADTRANASVTEFVTAADNSLLCCTALRADEESTSAYSAISNQEYGITWLDREFGTQYRPRTLWQIDPSGEQPAG